MNSNIAKQPPEVESKIDSFWRARVCFFLYIAPTVIKILWLHFFYSQGEQLSRLGKHRRYPNPSLPERWAHWAANKIARLVKKTPFLRQRPCYWRSQIIFDLLPLFGFDAELHLGARIDGNNIPTHFWVTMRGVALANEHQYANDYIELAVYTKDTSDD